MANSRPTVADFWAKVVQSIPVLCWEWRGRRDRQGYGYCQREGKRRRAHRLAFCYHAGLPVDHLSRMTVIRHTCDNPSCCNPLHLRAGSVRDNNRDRDERGRQKAPRGEQHGAAKLTATQVREIRCAYQSGTATQIALGRLYGCSRSLIGQIQRREVWRYLPETP